MYKLATALMLTYLLFTGQLIWFLAFGGALIVWGLLAWDDWLYEKRRLSE
ncbi:hypothetical protein [Enterococcus italicus]